MQMTEARLGEHAVEAAQAPGDRGDSGRSHLRRYRKVIAMSIAIGLGCVLGQPRKAWAQAEAKSAAELVKEGNEQLTGGNYREALAAFDRAREQAPESAVVAYDRGVALYRLGEFDAAETAFQDALGPEMPELEAKAKYNLGRCAHAQAVAGADDLETAIHDTGRAIGFYKEALQLRPDDSDAKQNLGQAERLQRYLKKKLELLQQQQEKQPASQPSEQESESSSQASDEEQEPSSQPNEQQQGSQPTDDEQQGESEQKGEDTEAASRPQESEGKPQEEELSEQEQEDREASSRAEAGEEEQESQERATQPQDQPATQSATQPDEEAMTQPESMPAAMATTQPEGAEEQMLRLSREQALRMLQEARDAERQRREVLREMLMRQQGQIPVEKDW